MTWATDQAITMYKYQESTLLIRRIAAILVLVVAFVPALLGMDVLWPMIVEPGSRSLGAAEFVFVCFFLVYGFGYFAWRIWANKPWRKDGGLFPPSVILPFAYFWIIGGAAAIVKHLYTGNYMGAFHAFEFMMIGSAGLVIVKRRKAVASQLSYRLPAARKLEE